MKEVLSAIWEGWKKLARAWGKVVNTILLSLVFFTVFGLMALVAKLSGQDLLDARQRSSGQTAWRDWERGKETLEDSLRQS